jgi:hypothetical protein
MCRDGKNNAEEGQSYKHQSDIEVVADQSEGF